MQAKLPVSLSQRHSYPPGARVEESFFSAISFLSPDGKGWSRKAAWLHLLVVSDLPCFLGGGKKEGSMLRRAGSWWRGCQWLSSLPTHLSWLRWLTSLASRSLSQATQRASPGDSQLCKSKCLISLWRSGSLLSPYHGLTSHLPRERSSSKSHGYSGDLFAWSICYWF